MTDALTASMCHIAVVPKAFGRTSLQSPARETLYMFFTNDLRRFIHEVCCDFYELKNNLVHSHSNLFEFYLATYVRTN